MKGLLRIVAVAVLAGFGGVTFGAAAVPPGENEEPSPAVAAMQRAASEIEDWRKAIDDGAELDEKELAELSRAAQRIYGNLEDIARAARRNRTEQLQQEHAQRMTKREQAQTWVDAMRALGPEARQNRDEAVAAMRAALESGDEAQQLAALEALSQLGDVNYDKASFRPLIVPIVKEAESGPMIVSACYALFNTDSKPGDLALVQSTWQRRTPLVDNSISHLLRMYGEGIIAGRSEEIVLQLLADDDAGIRRECLRGLWGAEVSGDLAARVVELADDPESQHDAIYFGLSTFKPKNEAVVDKLIETLAVSDHNDWGRALWGLGYGVPEGLQPKVAEALADMYVARSDPRTRQTCRDLIKRYAGEEAAAALPQ
ncbi:MAG: hypothetical protein CMJ58_26760 [Planctomycetaceae bacterium]|nr:hypothetical protein [Planctomycetaceae bacterium]